MTVSSDLFGSSHDWLSHTLDNADASLPETKAFLPDGTRISRKAVGVLDIVPPAACSNPNAEAIIVSAGVHGNEARSDLRDALRVSPVGRSVCHRAEHCVRHVLSAVTQGD